MLVYPNAEFPCANQDCVYTIIFALALTFGEHYVEEERLQPKFRKSKHAHTKLQVLFVPPNPKSFFSQYSTVIHKSYALTVKSFPTQFKRARFLQ